MRSLLSNPSLSRWLSSQTSCCHWVYLNSPWTQHHMHITQLDCFRSSLMRAWWEESHTIQNIWDYLRLTDAMSPTQIPSFSPVHLNTSSVGAFIPQVSLVTTYHINAFMSVRIWILINMINQTSEPCCSQTSCHIVWYHDHKMLYFQKKKSMITGNYNFWTRPCLCSFLRCTQVCSWICRFMPERFHWLHSSLGWLNWTFKGPSRLLLFS